MLVANHASYWIRWCYGRDPGRLSIVVNGRALTWPSSDGDRQMGHLIVDERVCRAHACALAMREALRQDSRSSFSRHDPEKGDPLIRLAHSESPSNRLPTCHQLARHASCAASRPWMFDGSVDVHHEPIESWTKQAGDRRVAQSSVRRE